MASRRTIRELALQLLYLIDARRDDADEAVTFASAQAPLADEELVTAERLFDDEQRATAEAMARGAWAMHVQADDIATELAPGWPTSRQPAVDRAILRLAWYEMASATTPAKAAINEAVELAKRFSTDRSPAFINGVLDKMMRRLDDPSVAPLPSTPTSTAVPDDAWLDDAISEEPETGSPQPE